MNREEALEHFRKGKAAEICTKKQKEIYHYFRNNKEKFEDKLREGFVQIVEKLQETGDNRKIAFIEYSFLRVHILDGTYTWLVEAQDDRGSFDQNDQTISIQMSEFFSIWEELKEELKKEALQYVNALTESDCEQIVLEEFNKLQLYFLIMGVKAFRNIDQLEAFSKLNKTKLFRILLGERRDKVQLVYIMEDKKKSQEEIIKSMSTLKGEEDFTSREFVLRDFRSFHIADLRITVRNLSFSSFQYATMQGVEITITQFIAADFDNATIRNSQIDLCTFHNASFQNAQIDNTTFVGCGFGWVSDKKEEMNPVLYPVYFHNAVLKNVNFAGCDLRYCDFSKATLLNVDFSESLLEGACFSKDVVSSLNLSEEQREGIQFI